MEDSTLISIKQFAKFTGVNQSTLRYYDEIGLLPAASRGKENNYRLYKPSQRRALNFINVLVDLGVPLSEIKTMNEGRTPESLITLLAQQELKLDYKLYELRTAYSIIHTFRRNIQNGLMGKAGEIRLEVLEDTRYILGPENDFGENDIFNDPYVRFCNAAKEYRINLHYPIGGYYYDMDAFLSDPNHPNKYLSLDPIGNCTREAGQYLVGYKYGCQDNFEDLPERMAGYAEDNDLILSGPVYAIYLLDEISTKDPNQYLSRISVNVSRKNIKRKSRGHEYAKDCPLKPTCVRPHCVAK